MKIDGNSVVPVGWVLSGFAAVMFVVIIGAFWVSAVDYRLERIEVALGIPPLRSDTAVSPRNAFAMERKPNVDAKRLPDTLRKLHPNR